MARSRDPQPRPGFSHAVVERTDLEGDPKVPAQIRVHLRHRSPTAFLEPFLHRLPCLGADAVGPTGVVGTAVLEQGFDPAQTAGIESLLDGGTGVADGSNDMVQVVDRIEAELHGQKQFPPGTFRFGAEQPGYQRRLSDRIQGFLLRTMTKNLKSQTNRQ